MAANADLLTVCVITYNHERYIARALDSILNQEVDFHFKILIADDCSKDSTREILMEYQSKHPDKIQLILQEKNVGPLKNWTDLVTSPKSEYLAYLEGDDYWLDTHKLQNQIELLEQNPKHGFCGSIAQVLKDDNLTRILIGQFEKYKNLETINTYHFFKLSSLLIKRELLSEIMSEYHDKIILTEFTILNMLFEKSSCIYYKAITSIYRITRVGAYSGLSSNERIEKHFITVRSMRKNLRKNWSFNALQELTSYLIVLWNKIKSRNAIGFLKEYFFSQTILLVVFTIRLGFITSIPAIGRWYKEKRRTKGMYS